MKQAVIALLSIGIASLNAGCFGSFLSVTLSGEIISDYSATFTLSASSAIDAPDTSGAYPVYTVHRSSLPLTVSATSEPAATGYAWVLDGVELAPSGSSVTLDATALSARKHNLTLFLTKGTDPKRSATIIVDTTH